MYSCIDTTVPDIRYCFQKNKVLREGERVLFLADNCAVLERSSGKSNVYRAVNLYDFRQKHLYSSIRQLTRNRYDHVTEQVLESTVNYLPEGCYRQTRHERAAWLLREIFCHVYPEHGFAVREQQLSLMDGSFVAEIESGRNGYASLGGQEPGFYQITEVRAPEGYKLFEGTKTVELRENKPAEVEFVNEPLQEIIVRKVSPSGEPLAGTQFEVERIDGSRVGSFTTDRTGSFTISGQQPGFYKIYETKAPQGYLLNSEPKLVELTTKGPVSVEFVNQQLNSLTVFKKNSVNSNPVSGCVFRLEKLSGELVGTYTTAGVTGSFVVSHLQPGAYRCYEISVPAGFTLNPTPQTFELKDGDAKAFYFENVPLSGFQLLKWDCINQKPVPNVEFSIRDLNGKPYGTFITDSQGYLFVPGLQEGWIEVTETKPAPGYKPDYTPKRYEVKAGQPNYLKVDNLPWAVLSIQKVDKDTSAPLAGVKIRISDAFNREIGTYTTTKSGSITLSGMDAQTVYVQEVATIPGYQLDTTVQQVTLEWGRTAKVELQNKKLATFRLLKRDSVTKKPIYNCAFLLYDWQNHVIGEFTTDQNGMIAFPSELPEGRYKIKEIRTDSAHVLDDTVRTVTLKSGAATEIVVENEPVRGRIQITKKSAEYNDLTKKKAGAYLADATFEIFDSSNTVVDRITTNGRGIATSKPLPLGIYGIREISAPKHYILNDKVFYAELKVHNDLVQFEVLDENEDIGVTIQKIGNIEAMPGDLIRYDLKGISNASNIPLDDFYVRDLLPTNAIRLEKVVTGTWSEHLTYKLLYKTNYKGWRTLADNLSTQVSKSIDCGQSALGLRSDEVITEIKLEFGTVQPGFHEVKNPEIYCTVNADLPDKYNFTNCADVGGSRDGEWAIDKDCWTSVVYGKPKGKLPKTGF